MAFVETTALRKILKLNKRIRFVNGGTSSSKTISILMWLMDYAQTHKNEVISVVGESVPFLKRGAIRDFINIMRGHGYYKEANWNRTDFIYTFETGSIIEFFSADNSDKVRGPRRDILYLNEGNNNSYETYTQLEIRTRKIVFVDSNPTYEYWMYTEVLAKQDIDFLTLTYKDNEGLEQTIIDAIESRKGNKQWYLVYGLGQLGEVEGKIFTNWKVIDEVPHEARLEVRGGDFGFAADPTAFCDIYYYNGGYIIDELCYRTNFFDTDLGNLLLNQPNPNVLAIADSADDQKIQVLQQMGLNIIGVQKKGTGTQSFTNAAISFVQDQKVSITKRSTNYIKSYRNFMWQTDKEGNIIPKYDHYLSDGMMSVVYGMTNFDVRRKEEDEVYSTGNLASTWSN